MRLRLGMCALAALAAAARAEPPGGAAGTQDTRGALTRWFDPATAPFIPVPLIGVDPNDPYGRIMAAIFATHALHYEVTIRARFGSAVCALVSQGLGIAIIDEFTLAADNWPNICALDIAESTLFQTYVVHRKDVGLSSYGARFVAALRGHMEATARRSGRKK